MEICITIITFLFIAVVIMVLKIKKLSSKRDFKEKRKHLEAYPGVITPDNFELILKSISEGIVVLDKKGNILFSNKSFKELVRAEESPDGKNFIEVIRNINLLNLLKTAMTEKKEVEEELTVKKGGGEISILAKAMPVIHKDGKVEFLIIILHDITKLKKLEKIRRDFVANASHELKTPITAIKGYAESLIDGALDDRENAKKFIEIIKNQTDRLSILIDDLLTLSKIESGETKIEKERIVFDDLVLSVFQIFKEKADNKGIQLEREITPDLEINADRNKLMQILINLIDNGIKFTEKGYVKVKAKLSKNNGSLIISVEDTGIGIPKQHLPRIGERFYRVDSARSRELGGTGLGLAIVKHLVLAHGWDFIIESEIGKGTEIKIIIPSKDFKVI